MGLANNLNKFEWENEIPFSVLLLGEYARTKNQYSELSYSLDKNVFPNTIALSNFLHANKIFFGLNIKTDGVLSIEEEHHNDFVSLYSVDSDKNIPINVFDSAIMNGYLKGIITPLLNKGIDMLWVDDNKQEHAFRNFIMNYKFSQAKDLLSEVMINNKRRPIYLVFSKINVRIY